MILLKTHQELIALDLGMQAIATRGLQVQLDEAQSRIAELEKKIATLEAGTVKKAPIDGYSS